MSAGAAVQSAVVEGLAAEPRLTGIYDGAPARAIFPYAVIDAGSEGDWSHKSGKGREVLIALTLWDEEPARLADLADKVEGLVAGLRNIPAWDLVSLQFLRRRTLRDVAGPWATAIDFRARLLVA